MASLSPPCQPPLSLGNRDRLTVKNTFITVGSLTDLSPGAGGAPDRRSSLSWAPEALSELGGRRGPLPAHERSQLPPASRSAGLLQVPRQALPPRGLRSPGQLLMPARAASRGPQTSQSPSPRYIRVPRERCGGLSPAGGDAARRPSLDVASLPSPARTASRWPSACMGEVTPARTASRWPSVSFEGLDFEEVSPRGDGLAGLGEYSPAFTASRWPSANLDCDLLDLTATSEGLSFSLDACNAQAPFAGYATPLPCDQPADVRPSAEIGPPPFGCFATPVPCSSSEAGAEEDGTRSAQVAPRRVALSLDAVVESRPSSAAPSSQAALSALEAPAPTVQHARFPAMQNAAPQLPLAEMLSGAAATGVAPGAQASAQAAVALFQQAQQLAAMANLAAAMSMSAQAPVPPGLAACLHAPSAATAAPPAATAALPIVVQDAAPARATPGKRGGGRRALRMWAHLHLHMQAPGFDLVPRLIGRGGCNVRCIAERTGAKIRVRGRGSGHLEANGGTAEAPCPLMVAVTTDQQQHGGFAPAVEAVLGDLRALEQRFRAFCEQSATPHDGPCFSVGLLGPGARDLLGSVLDGVADSRTC